MPHSREVIVSRRVAVFVNLAKFLQLAALTPPVVTGIAQRASELGGSTTIESAALVATAATVGSLCAIVGALALGELSDLNLGRPWSRWYWVILGALIGSVGLVVLSLSHTAPLLVIGWGVAQLGFSGALAVLRAILGSAFATERQRGAIVLVIGGYGGMLFALAALLLIPSRIWETTFGLAALSVALPVAFLWSVRREVEPSPTHALAPEPSRGVPTTPQLPRWLVLAIQCAGSAVLAAFVSYHPLDIVERAGTGGGDPTRATVWVLVAAATGLIGVSCVLLARPRLLDNSRRAFVFSGVVLATSLVLRAVSEPLFLVMSAAVLSGVAVGVNSSTLLAAALAHAPRGRGGRYLGMFSAAGVAGQLAGPLLGLGVLTLMDGGVTGDGPAGLGPLFAWLALIPAAWALVAAATAVRRTDPPVPAAERQDTLSA